jgi:hypothetical protein
MAVSVAASAKALAHVRVSRQQRSVAGATSTSQRFVYALPRRSRSLSGVVVRATPEEEKPVYTEPIGSVDVDKVLKDLQEKWDAVDNKAAVAIYGGASIVVLWLSSTIVTAVNAVPIVPKVLELVGLGYTAWFVYRYLLFKSSREELLEDIEELKKKISGTE